MADRFDENTTKTFRRLRRAYVNHWVRLSQDATDAGALADIGSAQSTAPALLGAINAFRPGAKRDVDRIATAIEGLFRLDR